MSTRTLFKGLFVLWLVLLTACQGAKTTPAPTAAPTTSPPTATAPAPTPTPPPPTATALPQPTPTPTPILQGPLPVLPPDAAMPSAGTFPILHAANDDPTALQAALQALNSSGVISDLWVAAWPPDFPAREVPLPASGQLVAATLDAQSEADVWTLYLVASSEAQPWANALSAAFQQAGWQTMPAPPEMFGGYAIEQAWCHDAWGAGDAVMPLGQGRILVSLSYVHNLTPHQPPDLCAPAFIQQEPNFAPHLQAPPGLQPPTSMSSGGDGTTWQTTADFRSPNGLQPLVEGFQRQLRAQGWQLNAITSGTLGLGAEGALLQGSRTDTDGRPLHLVVMVWGKAPDYHLWLMAGVQPTVRAVRPPQSVRLHGQLNDPRLLQRALAVLAFSPGMAQPPEIWIGAPPTPWPFEALPQPEGARWVAAEKSVFAGEPNTAHWSLFFARFGYSPSTLAEQTASLLRKAGWRVMPPAREVEPGFFPDVSDATLHTTLFCTDGAFLSQTTQRGQPNEQRVRVTWNLTLSPRGCSRNHPPPPTFPGQPPMVQLYLLPGAVPTTGGTSIDRVQGGYLTHLIWFSDRPLDEQMADFRRQMQQQGWEPKAASSLGDDTAWALLTHNDRGRPWDAQVIVIHSAGREFIGLLRVARPTAP